MQQNLKIDPAATVVQLLQRGSTILAAAAVEQPRLCAEVLLAKTIAGQRVDLYLEPDRILSAEQRQQYLVWIARRQAREPLAYIVGEKEFYSRLFKVDQRVLIPRPESEMLVDQTLALAGRIEQPRILEIGTGSGAIAISLALELPQSQIVTTDLSQPALQVARKNARAYGVEKRISFCLADLYAAGTEKFHFIVTNPPYVAETEQTGLSPEVSRYEPMLALDGGADGLQLISKIIAKAAKHLTVDGTLLCEIGQGQAEGALQLAGQVFANVELKSDLSGIPRILIASNGADGGKDV